MRAGPARGCAAQASNRRPPSSSPPPPPTAGPRGRPCVGGCTTDTVPGPRGAWARPVHRGVLRRAQAVLVHTEEARALVETWGTSALLLPDDLPDAAQAEPRPAASRPTVLVAGS